jgi:hypothetical protein
MTAAMGVDRTFFRRAQKNPLDPQKYFSTRTVHLWK